MLYGPFPLILDSSLSSQLVGVAMLLVCVLAVVVAVVRPRWWSCLLAGLAVVMWAFVGHAAVGINC